MKKQNNLESQCSSFFLKDAKQVTAQYGKTFYFASFFMGQRHTQRSYKLYQLCRFLDDIADTKGDSSEEIGKFNTLIKANSHNNQVSLCEDFFLPSFPLEHLIEGFLFDQNTPLIEDVDGLIRYCYQVAGTVGVMMCHALDTVEEEALPHAIDLGIAMQMTNIARDVFEDAKMGRIYIPTQWLGEKTQHCLYRNQPHIGIRHAQIKLLELAERYYKSGLAGLHYLPLRSRFAILIAAQCYRAIGKEVISTTRPEQRAYVPIAKKMIITSQCTFNFIKSGCGQLWREKHDLRLHDALGVFFSPRVRTSF